MPRTAADGRSLNYGNVLASYLTTMASQTIAHLGPSGTYAETATLLYVESTGLEAQLCPYTTIPQAIEALEQKQVDLAVVPVENSLEGSVNTTLDTLWRSDQALQIQQALVLSIEHQLITLASNFNQIHQVFSHPQALGQCQWWLDGHLPAAQRISTNSTTEILAQLGSMPNASAISSSRAAQIYGLPVLAGPIGDQPGNQTRFLVLGYQPATGGTHTSLAFTLPANQPGVLLSALEKFARHNINLSRIESRPTKRSLGEYLFFVDLEVAGSDPLLAQVLQELKTCVEKIKSFGSYHIKAVD
jgi:prephenate dehydratase